MKTPIAVPIRPEQSHEHSHFQPEQHSQLQWQGDAHNANHTDTENDTYKTGGVTTTLPLITKIALTITAAMRRTPNVNHTDTDNDTMNEAFFGLKNAPLRSAARMPICKIVPVSHAYVGGLGVIANPPSQEFYTPLFYTPPLEGCFQGWGVGVSKSVPPSYLF